MADEVHIEEHSSPIKTPGQLLAVIVLSFAVPITLISMLAYLATSSGDFGKSNPAMSDEAIAKRLKPVGAVVVTDPNAPVVAKSGKEVVDGACAACHATGALNAPKVGDKAAWAKLIPQGLDKLTKQAIAGVRQMPPRGGDSSLADIEVARAVAHMANQSGANFKEPADKPTPAKPAAKMEKADKASKADAGKAMAAPAK